MDEYRQNFDTVMNKFRNKELLIEDWNFAYDANLEYFKKTHGNYSAYIMGCGAEQCLAKKHGFQTSQEIVELFKTIGVDYVLRGV